MQDFNKMTKGELAEQNLDLQKQLELAEEEREAAATDMQERVERMEKLLAGSADNDIPTPDPNLFYDPYDAPHKILKHPEGKRLSWKNPLLRDQRGWRGWTPVTYDDEIGSKLLEYITEAPTQMSNIATQDNYVRRGTDSILSWLPQELWDHRQMVRESRAQRKQRAANNVSGLQTGNGVSSYGDGVVEETNPAKGAVPQAGNSLLRSKE